MGADNIIQLHCHAGFPPGPDSLAGSGLDGHAPGFDLNLAWFRHLADTALVEGEGLRLWHAIGPEGQLLLPTRVPFRSRWRARRLAALGNYYTSLFAPIGQAGQRKEAILAICRRIAGDRPAWDVVDLRPMDPQCPDFPALEEGLARAGFFVHRYFCFGNWHEPTEGLSFAQYWVGRPTALKNTARRKGNAFARAGGRLEIVQGGEKLEAAIRAYESIYAASWKIPEPHPAFMPGLIRLAASRGWLRLGLAWYDGQPVAAQVWLVVDARAAIYKLAYDERQAGLSAGTLLTAHLMRHVLDVDRVREVDYLIGDEPYKRDWMSHRRERWGIVAYNSRTLRGRFGAMLQAMGEWRRAWIARTGRPGDGDRAPR